MHPPAPQKLVFTGGEPLLRADIFDLLDGFRKWDREHRIRLCLNSNGYGVSNDVARRLVGLVDEVRVSIDALENRNDAVRGNGSFTAALRALDTLYLRGFEPKVLITITRHTLLDLEGLICLLAERNYPA
jgi:MoaA/NifB/PqqE/SkfB family radical SAM enzyme